MDKINNLNRSSKMLKLECMSKFYRGASYLFLFFWDYMINKKYSFYNYLKRDDIISAIISFISVMMVSIKEDIVEKNKDKGFSSKLFVNALEKTVSMISTKKGDKYYIDGYEFTDAATLVSFLRNKLAHGDFYLNYEKNTIVLLQDNTEIKLNIRRLLYFVMSAFNASIRDIDTNIYERNICVFNKNIKGRFKSISTLSEMKDIIRNIKFYSFVLTSDNGSIDNVSKKIFDNFVDRYEEYDFIDGVEIYNLFKNVEMKLKQRGCTVIMNSKKGVSKDAEERLLAYAETFLTNKFLKKNSLNYERQIVSLLKEASKYVNQQCKRNETLTKSAEVLFLFDDEILGDFSNENLLHLKKEDNSSKLSSSFLIKLIHNLRSFIFDYDVIGLFEINIFNALFMYGYDDVLTKSGGYKLDRSDEFDFKKLNFDKLVPIKDGIDYVPLNLAKKQYTKIKDRKNALIKQIKKRTEQLSSITDEKRKESLTTLINGLQSELEKINNIFVETKNKYDKINKDYTDNLKYFKNKAIINGIRNSIAHGNYEIVIGEHADIGKIIFTDIYDGRETFKIEININDFFALLQANSKIVLDYVEAEKVKLVKQELYDLENEKKLG